MRPKTSESGIFSTKRNKPVSTSMLTRMLVPKPKKAFQSPGVQSLGSNLGVAVAVAVVMDRSPSRTNPRPARLEGGQHSRRVGDPAEDAALRLDHAQGDLVELGEIRGAA